MEDVFLASFFLVGILVGGIAVHFYSNKLHLYLEELDQKYNRLVNLISEWQKKV